ncbi:MAG: hypothetical protein CO034_02380 [Parcubacteria group bacterium CG_4_9_14_0_2_um_filter_35_11]|nr:MAG: hypothetical protein COS98_01565 [Parcubacteria group bacterium CG07_land_8_20_14_0_80_35_11]PJC47472.1 MAG: hypothetical protein CO034_02380 [Parcubacteria group bacterium CG_4_9_14_0_2_um_filter_35_11]
MAWIDINKILKSVKSRPQIKDKLKEQIIKKYLQKKRGIRDIVFRKGTLKIKVESTGLFQELFLNKENFRKEINDYLKEDTVEEVVLKRG